ncbi:D-cysteine desulfhydrase [Evansella cellulosilytica]|uniref:Pyridoxal phosphate-dependent enzyme, D-cysteine desulfhydrase family n=1 Tax=Evansella cellulosilytica (strain ATCC 21833 / DSM 2522 / FERM P-1141 / JCM 9156 / N-4) TaxID=649639 RepID=E6TQH1_EVAC2|nr:D-cysteine desulfhydrase [Evansella cellulosilytica]ADU29349.1 pyridoxal phosphate-dependent enzyme, D-cysteine desulfhydrase family [Evansella cellulosilytica DSM 2522]
MKQFPRRIYTEAPTPIEKVTRFAAGLGGPNLYIKRDDLLGLTAGGNKTRKLEFLMGDALEKGADTIITAGGIQSNHCRLTLAACVKEGLKCILVLEENELDLFHTKTSGNFLLFQLLGTENVKVVPNGTDVYAEMEKLARQVRGEGRTPYVIPVGGSNVTGITGYAACAEEIIEQAKEQGIQFDYVVCTSGSGGMHAGLVAGLLAVDSAAKVIGINISRGKEEQEEKVYQLTKETAKHLGLGREIPREAVVCFDDYVGPGYALPTEEMVEAVKRLASTEAILLDPVYTGKTMAGLIDLSGKNYFQREDNILFLHSGGTPALYAYASLF